jgi:hemoglobin
MHRRAGAAQVSGKAIRGDIMTAASAVTAAAEPQQTPFEALGGRDAVRRLVAAFYDTMEGDPRFAELRAMHAPDLGPMRHSLAGFLTAWLGGPRDWFEEKPGMCMMSLHRALPITPQTAAHWVAAMDVALAASAIPEPTRTLMAEAFQRMAIGMSRR